MPDEDWSKVILAVKCRADERILDAVSQSGIMAVEIYTDLEVLKKVHDTIKKCHKFPFRYAVHAPIEGFEPERLVDLAGGIDAEVVVFHDVYFDDEWLEIRNLFSKMGAKVCVENVTSGIEPVKFMRRFGFGCCLDLEHLQLETNGIHEESFLRIMKQASHVHLTGYIPGSDLWHTNFHKSPKQSTHLLNMLRQVGYKGFVVSEAKVRHQVYEEFKGLYDFFNNWSNNTKETNLLSKKEE